MISPLMMNCLKYFKKNYIMIWRKIGLKNVSVKKKRLEFWNENDNLEKQKNSLNEKIKCLEIENKMLHDKTISFKENKALHLSMKIHMLMIWSRRIKLFRRIETSLMIFCQSLQMVRRIYKNCLALKNVFSKNKTLVISLT